MGVGWTVGGVSTNSVGGSFVLFFFGRLGAFIDWSLTLSHRNSTDCSVRSTGAPGRGITEEVQKL